VFLVVSGATLTRSQAKNWIDAGHVRVNGLARKAGFFSSAASRSKSSGRRPPVAEPEDFAPRALRGRRHARGSTSRPAWWFTWRRAVAARSSMRSFTEDSRRATRRRMARYVHRLDKETWAFFWS
jgi:hypothetical protein